MSKRLLIVDDSDINLEIAARILELEGARVTSATNGQEAVDLLRTQPSEFDAVLMDVQMPVLDGIKATLYIRSVLGLSSLPIIALTAGALLSERQRATDAGMNDFISKPFEPARDDQQGGSAPIAVATQKRAVAARAYRALCIAATRLAGDRWHGEVAPAATVCGVSVRKACVLTAQ